MKTYSENVLAKVPEVTLGFWLIKIATTTLGETGGDAASMSMNLGYLTSTGIFAAFFVIAVAYQIKSKHSDYSTSDFHEESNMDSQQVKLHQYWMNKVPEIGLSFWIIKIMSTTVGETGADFLAFNVGWGQAITSAIMATFLATVLFAQLKTRRHIPWFHLQRRDPYSLPRLL